MCRTRRQQQDEITDDTSPYDKKVDDFFDGVHRVSDKLSEKTKQFLARHHDAESRWRGAFSRNLEIDQYMNKPYQTRDGESRFPFGIQEAEFALADLIPRFSANFFDVFDESSGATPYGLYAYQSPSPRAYDICVEKRGTSLWDTSGYWRCLFPNSAVSAGDLQFKRDNLSHKILTKEDFEESARGKDGPSIDLGPKGVFFKHYNDYLKWRNNGYRQQKDAVQKDVLQEIQPYTMPQVGNEVAKGAPKVVGTEVKSFMNSDDNEMVQKEIKTEYFSDGTSKTSNIVRKKPIGSDTWATVTSSTEDGKSGWFWN